MDYCKGCGAGVWLKHLSRYMLCRKCEAISKRLSKIPTCGWDEPLKDRPKKGAVKTPGATTRGA